MVHPETISVIRSLSFLLRDDNGPGLWLDLQWQQRGKMEAMRPLAKLINSNHSEAGIGAEGLPIMRQDWHGFQGMLKPRSIPGLTGRASRTMLYLGKGSCSGRRRCSPVVPILAVDAVSLHWPNCINCARSTTRRRAGVRRDVRIVQPAPRSAGKRLDGCGYLV